jgi:hypothetical protein
MFNTTYYHDSLRKYVIYFGTLFNDIYINREVDGEVTQSIKVPLSYGPKEPMLARLEADPELDRPTAIVLPRIAFEMTNFKYDKSRHLATVGKRGKISSVDSSLKYIYNPVPYNIEFQLYIMVKSAQDGTRIVEQILPYFTPEWTATINLIPEMSITHDVPVVLTDVSMQDTYDVNFQKRRAIIWTMKFTMKGYLYGPAKDSKIINTAIMNLFVPDGLTITESMANGTPAETLTVYPGLTANGDPTSNSAESVVRTDINASDNYGYITDFESFI